MRTWLSLLIALIVAAPTALIGHADDETPAEPAAAEAAEAAAPEAEGDFDPMTLSSAEFLAWARRPPIENSFTIMKGTITHRADRKNHVVNVQFRARMDPRRIIGQFIIDDNERYGVSQVFADGAQGTTVLQERAAPEGHKTLRDFGLRPTDLTLSFLYWDFLEEVEPERIANRRVRVYRLRHAKSKEICVVAIDAIALFPLRAEWTLDGAEKPYRKLEFKSFLNRDGVLIPSQAKISNTGWKTELRFTDVVLKRVDEETPVPTDLFVIDGQ